MSRNTVARERRIRECGRLNNATCGMRGSCEWRSGTRPDEQEHPDFRAMPPIVSTRASLQDNVAQRAVGRRSVDVGR